MGLAWAAGLMATRFAGHRLARGSTTERAQRLRGLNEDQFGGQGAERIQAAIVFMSHGSWGSLVDGLGAHEQDWRDVLVNGGLADDDWPAVLAGNLVPPALDLKPCALGTTSGMSGCLFRRWSGEGDEVGVDL